MKSTVPPSQAQAHTDPVLPPQVLAGGPTMSLGAYHGVLSHPHPELRVHSGGWQETRLSAIVRGCWAQLEAWSSFPQLPGIGSQGMLVLPGFPGTRCPATHVTAPLGSTRGLPVGTFYPIMKGIWNEMTPVLGSAGQA